MTQKLKVLVIDDTEIDRIIIADALEAKDFEIVALEDGSRCMETIETEKPDLVLLDIMLPDCDGRDLLKLIRERQSSIQLPVIMVTAKADSADVVDALRLGANDYITKPVDSEIALMRVRTQMQVRDLSRQASQLAEIAAAHALVVTYNHELNNALAIAVGVIHIGIRDHPNIPCLVKANDALNRITNVLKAITEVTHPERGKLETETYAGDSLMLKLK